MKQLSVNEKVFDLNKRDFLNSIQDLSKGYYILAEAYHNYHISGFADLNNAFRFPDKGQDRLADAMAKRIDDEKLMGMFNYLREKLQEMKQVDKQIINWMADFLIAVPTQKREDMAAIKRRLKKAMGSKSNSSVKGPVWVLQPEYQEILKKSDEIMLHIKDVQHEIEQRIQELLEQTKES